MRWFVSYIKLITRTKRGKSCKLVKTVAYVSSNKETIIFAVDVLSVLALNK